MKRRLFVILFILALSFNLVATVPVGAATTYTVDDDWQIGSPPYAEDTDPDTDFATIQAAINAASPDDTINVAAGTYTENVVIAKSLDLLGANSTTTIIDGNNIGNTVTITASDVTVSGFRVTDGFGGVHDAFYPEGGIVIDPDGVIVLGDYHVGSALTGITIEDNIIDGNAGNGVYVSSAGDGGAADNIVIRNNQIFNNGGSNNYAGISLTHPNYILRDVWDIADWRRPKNILLQGNTVYENSNYGVYVSAGRDIVILSNTIRDNLKYGLQLASSWRRTDIPCEYTLVEDNEIYDNERNGVKLTSYNQYNTFTGNNIYNNGFGGTSDRYKYGFLFQDGNDNTIQDNTITGNALGGLYLWGKGDPSYTWYSTTNNVITGNTISDHTAATGEHGIYIPSRSSYPNSGFLNSNINCNNITNNSAYGLENADVSQTIDAENNWWGDASGPYHPTTNSGGTGDDVSANVDYDPWLGQITSFVIDHAKIDFKKEPDGDEKVRVQGKFEVNLPCDFGVPTSESVTVHLGILSWTITMVEKGKKGEKWEYKRPKGSTGDIKHMTIDWKKGKFDIRMDKADLSGLSGPNDVTIGIQIGEGIGQETIDMDESKKGDKWEYKAPKGSMASEAGESIVQTESGLSQNYPNPFNPTTTIEYSLAEDSDVLLKIYSLSGKLIRTLVNEYQSAGYYSITWYGDNEVGQEIASGVYFYRIQAGDFVSTKKMVVLK